MKKSFLFIFFSFLSIFREPNITLIFLICNILMTCFLYIQILFKNKFTYRPLFLNIIPYIWVVIF